MSVSEIFMLIFLVVDKYKINAAYSLEAQVLRKTPNKNLEYNPQGITL